MDVENFRDYCLEKKGVTEKALMFKARGEMFAPCGLEHVRFQISLKCVPVSALSIKEKYNGISLAPIT